MLAKSNPLLRGAIVYIIASTIGISLMVNAPAILTGYGFVYAAAYYAILAYPPGVAALLFSLSHGIASIILIGSKAAFTIVVVASLLLRPPVVYVLARFRDRLGAAGVGFALAALDQLVALSIAILYYGDDGIHTALTIYELLLAPHVYVAYKLSQAPGAQALLGPVAAILGATALYLGSIVLPSLPAIAAGLLAPLLLLARQHSTRVAAASIVVAILGILLGHSVVGVNASVALYPFKPSSWGSERWMQTQPWEGCPETGNVFNATHSPERLRIIDTCMTVEGVVVGAPRIVDDGDYVFDIEPSQEYRWTLGLGNIILRKGGLHIEVVPDDHYKVLDPIGGGVCPGDHVRITGVYVSDTDHGMWTEIHPTYKIDVISRATDKPWPDCIRGIMPGDIG
ncbi:MAG: hypothetical protein F7B18_04315 [Desulfurococcales archaeon]|nr:hypothetical protein [Desulfurococcales archaeon]